MGTRNSIFCVFSIQSVSCTWHYIMMSYINVYGRDFVGSKVSSIVVWWNVMKRNEIKATEYFFFINRIPVSIWSYMSHNFFCLQHFFFWKASRSNWEWQTIDVLSKTLLSVNEKKWDDFFLLCVYAADWRYKHSVRGSERNVKCLKSLLLLTGILWRCQNAGSLWDMYCGNEKFLAEIGNILIFGDF